MLKNKKNHYVPDFEHQTHQNIKNIGGDTSYDPIHDYAPTQLGRDKINEVTRWFEKQEDVQVVLLIGSYAREDENIDSDIDFIILADDTEKWLENTSWVKTFGPLLSMNLEEFESVRALRVYYQDSNELEFGFVNKEWFDKPYVESTSEAMNSGMKVLLNKNDSLGE